MRINRAIGLGLALLIFQWFAGALWDGFERTTLTAFDVAESALSAAELGLERVPSFVPPEVTVFPD